MTQHLKACNYYVRWLLYIENFSLQLKKIIKLRIVMIMLMMLTNFIRGLSNEDEE